MTSWIYRSHLWIIILLSYSTLPILANIYNVEGVCPGTEAGISATQDTVVNKIRALRLRYENCTYVEGNLEISGLDDDEFYHQNLSFLNSIREVTGYVLIANVHVQYLPLENLSIIRGDTLFKPINLPSDGSAGQASGNRQQGYSLFVSYNYKKGSKNIGMRQLGLKNLTEISNGDVLFENNNLLCYATTDIVWPDILLDHINQKVTLHNDNDEAVDRSSCTPACHDRCNTSYTEINHDGSRTIRTGAHCWGPGPYNCQILNKLTCADQCSERCFGQQGSQCCHGQCSGGCQGPSKTDCWGCKRFYNDGGCVDYCPPPKTYDITNFNWLPNPDVKYAYANKLCVEKCPANNLEHTDNMIGLCVRSCPEGYNISADGKKCIECTGTCPKPCRINWPKKTDFLHADNIDSLKDCTSVEGHIRILQLTLDGDPQNDIPPMPIEKLEILSTIKEITEYLLIQSLNNRNLTNLSFFRNLEKIRGRALSSRYALNIVSNNHIEYLGLTSLRSIGTGLVSIAQNNRLCYADSIRWQRILRTDLSNIIIHENRPDCDEQGLVCDEECKMGCWGDGNTECMGCRNLRYKNQCVPDCNLPLLYKVPGKQVCADCHIECLEGCTGPEPLHCMACRNYQDGPFCVAICPNDEEENVYKYPDGNNTCQNCHPNCVTGCSGPGNYIGEGGCNACHVSVANDEGTLITHCLNHTAVCPRSYYAERNPTGVLSHLKDFQVCMRCDPLCEECNQQNTYIPYCSKCRYYQQRNYCVHECALGFYGNASTRLCMPCHENCGGKGCTGPTAWDCHDCAILKVYNDSLVLSHERRPESNESSVIGSELHEAVEETKVTYRFRCLGEDEFCPPEKNMLVTEGNDKVCQIPIKLEEEQQGLTNEAIIGISVAIFALVLMVIIVAAIQITKKIQKSKQATINKYLNGQTDEDPSEPLSPSHADPDMSRLRLIKESELRRGAFLGSGAFGTVYQGIWMPEGENVKIPIAIKVLQEGTPPHLRKELLEEARVMASVDHPCCVRYIAVCMTEQMMLITQLMPAGCLLDYVKKFRDYTSSKTMLNWCVQIAKGMHYLETKGIVHRDLAARNVLVQQGAQVRITDFGLAKLLDYNGEYQDTGGKMPIKWLALEAIQHRIFTHKTDVWSYGVTLWEIFTYGERPYYNVRATEVPDLLEKGERLPQPSICTIDIYMIMIKCWMINAESRPSFSELTDEFAKMARDPGRYLVIRGDSLMRLPSSTNVITSHELVRSPSVNETPGEYMDADVYLQYKSRGSTADHQSISADEDQVGGLHGRSLPHLLTNGHGASNGSLTGRHRSESLNYHRQSSLNDSLVDPQSATLPLIRSGGDTDVDGHAPRENGHAPRENGRTPSSSQTSLHTGERRRSRPASRGPFPPVFEGDYLQPQSQAQRAAGLTNGGAPIFHEVAPGTVDPDSYILLPAQAAPPTPRKSQNGHPAIFRFGTSAANFEYFEPNSNETSKRDSYKLDQADTNHSPDYVNHNPSMPLLHNGHDDVTSV